MSGAEAMANNITNVAVTIMALLAVNNSAQAEVYKWQDDLCDMEGEFDHKKYTSKQIEDSHFVIRGLTRSNLESFYLPMDIAALDKISMADLEILTEEYQQIKSQVERLDVLPQAQKYKQQLVKSIDSEYKTKRLNILAYVDPLQAIRLSPLMCKQYLAPFFKDEAAVQNKWQQLVEKRALTNRYAMSRYQNEKVSNPTKYAKIDLLTFGLGRCLVDQGYRVDSEQAYESYQKLNQTLFGQSLKQVCEEP